MPFTMAHEGQLPDSSLHENALKGGEGGGGQAEPHRQP